MSSKAIPNRFRAAEALKRILHEGNETDSLPACQVRVILKVTMKTMFQRYLSRVMLSVLITTIKQVALLWQRDRARHLSVEILQLKNISLENPIVWHYLRDSTFSRFDTIPDCDRHTHTQRVHADGQTHDDGIYRT